MQADNQPTKDTADESQPGNPGSPSPMTILTQKLQSRKKASDPDTEVAKSPCLICTVAPKNSGFVHGKTQHVCCCYRCSVKVWMTNGRRCPICNRKVSQVCKIFDWSFFFARVTLFLLIVSSIYTYFWNQGFLCFCV